MAEEAPLVRDRNRALAARPRRRACRLKAALAGLAALAVGGCAVGGGLQGAGDLGPAPAEDWIAGADGAPLALSRWPAVGEPRAVILGVHGFGDYGPSTFGAAAADWAARGIAVYAYDQRGFGRNASRGRWPGAEALIADLEAVAASVAARNPGLPLIVVGHSMGGGVALAAAGEGRLPDADGVVLIAPAIWGGAALDPLLRATGWAAAALLPDRRWTGRGVVTIRASDNDDVLRALARDPRYLRFPSSRELMGLVRVMDRAAAAAPDLAQPSLLLYGLKDQVAPRGPVLSVYASAGGRTEVIEYPRGWHLLLRDLQSASVRADIADWALALPRPPAPMAGSGE